MFEKSEKFNQPKGEEEKKSKKEGVDHAREFINKLVAESGLPNEEFMGGKSTVKFYGGSLKEDPEGKMVYDTRGFWSRIDQKGDRVLRTMDEHQVKNPGRMFMQHPKKFIKTLPFIADAKRYKGGEKELLENIHRLGLDDYYGPHQWGVEIKKPELFKKGIALPDIYRQDIVKSDLLDKIDRFDATSKAGAYLNEIHSKYGAVGEFNVYPVLFENCNEGEVSKPVIMLPAMIFNPNKNISEIEKKATDVLDFIFSVGAEEWRRTGDPENIKKAMRTALAGYEDDKVVSMTKSFAGRGRLTLPGDEDTTENFSTMAKMSRKFLSAHNVQRLQVRKEMSSTLRKLAIEVCEEKINNLNK